MVIRKHFISTYQKLSVLIHLY